MMTQDTGASASQTGLSQAEPEEVSALRASIPSAELKYEFFTPYHRGFDLVFDFLCNQPSACFERKPWSIAASHGYERSRDTRVAADGQYVGTAHSINERFALIAGPYRRFMMGVERAATKWAAEKQAADEAADLRQERKDAALCERILAASAIEARQRPDHEDGLDPKGESAVAESETPKGVRP